jgi:DegV family protein with EDD domain
LKPEYAQWGVQGRETPAQSAAMEASRNRKPKVRIVTDSAAQIDAGWAQDNHVALLAQHVFIDGHMYHEGIDLPDDVLSETFLHAPVNQWPRIEPPSVEDFGNTYRSLLRETSEIISLHVSSHLSDTVQNARIAADEFRGRANISIVDTQSVALGLNIIVRKVAQLAQNGISSDDIVRYTRGRVKHIYGAFIAEDLQYMAHSGCLRPAQAALGKMLGVIPFLTIEEGEIVAIEKVRSVDRALEKLVEFAVEFEQPEELAVLQLSPHPTEKTTDLVSMLRLSFPKLREIPLRNCGVTIGSIIGPTGIGVMIYEGK